MRIPFLWAVLAGMLAASSPMGATPGPQPDPALEDDGELWTAHMVDLVATYENERWKYDATYENQVSPQQLTNHLQNLSTSYFGALGLRVNVSIEICPSDPYGQCDALLAPSNYADYSVSAYVPTSRGPLYALVKQGGTAAQGTNRFYLNFDMDGSNNGDPTGNVRIPPADAGLQSVRVNIVRRVNDNPPTVPVGDATMQFTYEIPFSSTLVPAYAGTPHVQSVPDSMFRLFNDIGWDLSVNAILRPLNASTNFTVEYQFDGNVGGTVELFGFVAERAIQAPAPAGNQPAPLPSLPFIPGVTDNETVRKAIGHSQDLVVITAKALGTARIPLDGRVQFNLTGGHILGIKDDNSLTRAIGVVAPLRQANFSLEACRGRSTAPCRGGSQFHVGATELVVPVTDRGVKIDGYQLSDPGVSGQQAPGPVRDLALGVNSLRVLVRDEAGYRPGQDVRAGDLFALVPDTRNSRPLSGGGLSPSQRDVVPGAAPTSHTLSGNIPVKPLQDQKVSYYRVFALVYADRDTFYGMTSADRGYLLSVEAPVAQVPPGDGALVLRFTSMTTDYAHPAPDRAFEIRVFYQLDAPEAGLPNRTESVLLPEAGTSTTVLKITSEQPVEYAVRVSTTSGDVLPPDQTVKLVFEAAPPQKGLADRIPGLEAPLAVLAVLALAWVARRRGR